METGREGNASRGRCPDVPREQDQLAKQGRCRKIRDSDGAIQRWRDRRDPRMEISKAGEERVNSPILPINTTLKCIYDPPVERTGSGWFYQILAVIIYSFLFKV